MKAVFLGTRGSLASPGPETARYGGNTSCVAVQGVGGTVLVLDAGTGLRRLGALLSAPLPRVDLLLTHLHLDHIQGLGFFPALYDPEVEIHLWGPASATQCLRTRLTRYLSPPLFPVHLRDLPRPERLSFHDVVSSEEFSVGEFRVRTAFVCHPGPTVGYRIAADSASLAYLPDHEPALGVPHFPLAGDWTSGFALARGADLLVHDAQYTLEEYKDHVGWGHSAWEHAFAFAELVGAKQLVPFHHDPAHDDAFLDGLLARYSRERPGLPFSVTPATEGAVFEVG